MIMEAKFKYALKDMMQEMALEDINVTSLCKKCNCHRQTFYYHYQDIYDLVAAIFLNEQIPEVEKANNCKDLLFGFITYSKQNFSFLKSTYNSAAHELPDAFVYNKMMAKVFSIISGKYPNELNVCRTAARRYARLVSDEVGYVFKDKDLTPDAFEKKFSNFIETSEDILLPCLLDMARKENR